MRTRPNILLITADQMRWDCMGCMGNGVIRTPRLDALAGRGVLFRNAFTPDPICIPARASIMTGNYPHVCTGNKSNKGRIREGQPLLTNVLKSVGYRAYAAGKLHFVPYSAPGEPRLTHGFEHVDLHESGRILSEFDRAGKMSGLEDYFDYLKSVGWGGYTRAHGVGNNDVRPCPSPIPQEHHVDRWIADCTIRRIDQHLAESPDRPFFMHMSSPKPHSPYDPPRPWDTLYDPHTIPRPFGSSDLLASRNPSIESRLYSHATGSLSPEAWQVIRSYYYGCITFLDAMIGRVEDYLVTRGLLENTLILFTADHGDLLGDFGSAFKTNHLNGSVRIPFIVAGPGADRAMPCEALVGLQDILPTVASLAGATIGQNVQGADLSGLLSNPQSGRGVRDVYYSMTADFLGQSSMIADGIWKYIYSEANATEELYSQDRDIAELDNLASLPEYNGVLLQMRVRLREEAIALGDYGLLDENGFAQKDLDRSIFKTWRAGGSMGWRWY